MCLVCPIGLEVEGEDDVECDPDRDVERLVEGDALVEMEYDVDAVTDGLTVALTEYTTPSIIKQYT